MTIYTANSNLSYPAGQYKNEYVVKNDDGFVKLTTFVYNWSNDKQEY